MTEFNANLSAVLRYSMDDTENLLQRLHAKPEARLPHPSDSGPASNEHVLFRHVVADRLAEIGRTHEEGLLRNPEEHVVVHQGRVWPGTHNAVNVLMEQIYLDRILNRIAPDSGVPQLPVNLDEGLNGRPAINIGGSVQSLHDNASAALEAANRKHLTDSNHPAMGDPAVESALKRMRETPVEVVDWNHPVTTKIMEQAGLL